MRGLLIFILVCMLVACAFAGHAEKKHHLKTKHHSAKRERQDENLMNNGGDVGKHGHKMSRSRKGGLGNEIPIEIIGEPGPIVAGAQNPTQSSGGGLFDGIGNLINGVIGTAGNIASGVLGTAGNVLSSGFQWG